MTPDHAPAPIRPGDVFGIAVVIAAPVRLRVRGESRLGARLQCACGTEFEAITTELLRGRRKSCGCAWRKSPASRAVVAQRRAGHGTKVCPRCRRDLRMTEFSPQPSASDGHAVYCRPCHAEYEAERLARRRLDDPAPHR